MSADFFPGFLDEPPVSASPPTKGRKGEKPLPSVFGAPTPARPKPPVPPAAPKLTPSDIFRFRVRAFERGLSGAQRREVARRPRFRNQSYLRRIDPFDLTDRIP